MAIRCYICDHEDSSITYDPVDKRYCPCKVCQAIIFETIIGTNAEDDPEEQEEEEEQYVDGETIVSQPYLDYA
jgi:hypothetical protein